MTRWMVLGLITLVSTTSIPQKTSIQVKGLVCHEQCPSNSLPIHILLGTYDAAGPSLYVREQWKRLVPCPIAVYEDSNCLKRYVTGSLYRSKSVSDFLSYLAENGSPAERSFVFFPGNKVLVGWGQWIDFGERIE